MKARKWLVALLAVVMTCMMGVAFAACEPVLPEEGGETPTAEFTVTYYVGAKKYISKQVEYGNFAENLTPPDKEGSDFLYWCSDALMEHEFDFSTPITRDTNLYARYTLFKVYTATFDSAIPGKAVDVRRVQQHDTLTLPAAPVWEEGHKFLNWKNSDGTEYEVGATIPLEDDAEGNAPVLAFTAQWEAYTMTKTDKVDPTCTVDGNPAYFTCSACHKHYTAEDHLEECTTLVTPKTGHTYGDPVWQWNGKAHTATATFTCTKCEVGVDGHAVTKDAKVAGGVTSKEATCTEAGDMTYTATVEFNGKTYSDTITIVGEIPATGHSYGEEPVWTIDDDHTKMTATFTCTKCEDGVDGHTNEVTEVATKDVENSVPSNCTVKGHDEYTAQVTFNEKTYDGRITVELPTDDTKHDWNDAEWKTTSTSHYHVCKNNSTHHKDESTHSKVNNVCKICKYGYDGTNYYLVGTINSWASSDSKTFAMKRHEEGGNKFYIIVDLKPGDAFKIIYSSDYKNEANFNNVSKSCSEYRNFAAADGSNISLKGEAGHYLITMVTVSASGSKTITIDRYWYTYTVTFDLGYEPTEGERVTTQTVSEKDHKVTLTTPERDGYVFLGWRIDGQGDTTHTDSYNNVTGDMKFVAVWHEIQYYDVTFDLGAHAAEDIDMAPYAKQERVKENTMIKLPAAPAAAEGWEFASWQIGEQTLDPGAQYQLTSSITVKANWTERKAVTVTWYVDGVEEGHDASKFGGDVFAEEGITYNYKKDASNHAGCSFDGWYTSDEYTVKHTFTKLAGNTNIYGRWIRSTVTVTYVDEKGETVATKEAHVTETDGRVTALATASTDTQKKKYPHTDVDVWEITKWHLESTTGEVYTGTTITDDITLYGTWSEISEVTGRTDNNLVAIGEYTSSASSMSKAGTWNPASDLKVPLVTELTKHEIYTVTMRLFTGDVFRFQTQANTSTDWSKGNKVSFVHLQGKDGSGATAVANGIGVQSSSYGGDNNLEAKQDGIYTFVIVYSNNTPKLYVEKVEDIQKNTEMYYLVGSMTGWANSGCTPIKLGAINAAKDTELSVDVTITAAHLSDGKAEAKAVVGYLSASEVLGDQVLIVSNWDVSGSSNVTIATTAGEYKVTLKITNATTHKGTLTSTKYNTFSLTYDLDGVENGGGTYSDLPETKLAQAKYSFAIPEAEPEKAGFHFLGWQLDSDAENLHKAGETIDLAPGAHTLKAVFVNEYTITFEQGNYPGSNWKVDKTITSFDGATITLPELPDPENGQTYKKVWKKDGVEYTETTYKVTGDATFTAEYTLLGEPVEVTITWNVEGEDSSTTTPMSGDPIVAPEKSKEGYVFDGWYSEEGYNPDKKVAAEDLGNAQAGRVYHFYGRFIRSTITVTFYAQDGSEIVANKMTVTTDTENPKALTVDTTSKDKGTVKRFFTFQHWSTDAETDTVFTSGTEIIDDLNLYAWCTEDAESVGYVENNITYSVVGVRKTADKPSSLPTDMEDPTKATNPSLPLTKDTSYTKHNVFTIELDLYVGDWFQIVHEMSWDNQMGFVYLNQDDPLACPFFSNKAGSTSGNIIVKAGQAGRYRFTLYMKNKSYGVANASLSYEKLQSYEDTTPMVDTTGRKVNITGTMNGWTLGNTSHKLTFVGSTIDNNVSIYVFAAKYTFNSSVEFKFSSNNDWGSWEGNKGNTEINCNNGPYGNNGNITLSAGTYCFYYSMTINGRCYSAIFNASRY